MSRRNEAAGKGDGIEPGCDLADAEAFANRCWRNFREMALDLFAIEVAIAEEQILAN